SGVRMGSAIASVIERLLDDDFDPEALPEDEDADPDDYDDDLAWVCARPAQRVYVQRVGLTIAQARTHGLLARPLKSGDTRAASYRIEHGDYAYELDGLPAAVLQDLVRKAIEPLIDWSERERVIA